MSSATEIDPNEFEHAIPSGVFVERVTSVHHYTDTLFKFRITRPGSFRFRSGEFVMIGLPNAEKPVFRAYSIASPSWDDELEFFSIKVPNGPLTEHLQKIKVGDPILMRKKPTGTLVNDALLPGKRLWMFSTGTGIAPFASLVRDPETYEKFGEVILTHTCRTVAELKYGQELVEGDWHQVIPPPKNLGINPTGFHLTRGRACDLDGADVLPGEIEADMLIADKGSDADERVIASR